MLSRSLHAVLPLEQLRRHLTSSGVRDNSIAPIAAASTSVSVRRQLSRPLSIAKLDDTENLEPQRGSMLPSLDQLVQVGASFYSPYTESLSGLNPPKLLLKAESIWTDSFSFPERMVYIFQREKMYLNSSTLFHLTILSRKRRLPFKRQKIWKSEWERLKSSKHCRSDRNWFILFVDRSQTGSDIDFGKVQHGNVTKYCAEEYTVMVQATVQMYRNTSFCWKWKRIDIDSSDLRIPQA